MDAVFAVLQRGLALRNQLDAGEPVDWDQEQTALTDLLSAFVQETADPEDENDLDIVFSERANPEDRRRLTRTTLRFALVCWLDELLAKSPLRLSGNEAGERFWDEARFAEARGDLEALEAIYLCVMLGFRGAWRDKAAQLDSWATRIRVKLDQAASTWTMPASLTPPRWDPTCGDDLRYRRMTFSVLLTFSLMAPLVAALLWRM